MGFGKFDGPVPLPYALWNGLFVLFRTVLYIDVHRGLGHGLGQNAFSKIWLNFLARKVQEKAPKSSDFGAFMVDSTGLEPVTPCTSRATRSYFSVF